MFVYFNGLILGLSLIMALGPQNIFLIRQGAKRNHAFLSASICFFCDIVLISAAVVGLHQLLSQHLFLKNLLLLLGGLFLLYYGLSAINNGLKSQSHPQAGKQEPGHLGRLEIILLALGFSLLNPHAMIDTVVIIGSGSAQYPQHEMAFIAGVLSASMLWFFSLSGLTYYYAEILSREQVWRKIEISSGMLMTVMGMKLFFT